MTDHTRSYTTNRAVNRIIGSMYALIALLFVLVPYRKSFSLLRVGPISKVLFPSRFSILSPLRAFPYPFSFARARSPLSHSPASRVSLSGKR